VESGKAKGRKAKLRSLRPAHKRARR